MATILESGHTIEKVTGEEMERFKKKVEIYTDGAIRLWPEGWFLLPTFEKHANRVYNFKVKPTDVYVMTTMKSGTNWIQEIVWNLVHNPDLNNPDADISIDARCPFYEIDCFFDSLADLGVHKFDPNGEIIKKLNKLCPGVDPSEGVMYHLSAFSPDPRLIKTHLPCTLVNPDVFKISKAIYLARDPRDVMVSFYHFSNLIKNTKYKGTLEEFVDDYMDGRVVYGPYWEHVRLAWAKRNDPNFLFLFYEDLKQNPKSEIKKIDEFLGTNRTDQQINNIVNYTSFSNMKEKTKDNQPTSFDNTTFDEDALKNGASFFRKGKAGSWKEDFTPELEEKVNAWMRKNLIKFEFGDDFKYKV